MFVLFIWLQFLGENENDENGIENDDDDEEEDDDDDGSEGEDDDEDDLEDEDDIELGLSYLAQDKIDVCLRYFFYL